MNSIYTLGIFAVISICNVKANPIAAVSDVKLQNFDIKYPVVETLRPWTLPDSETCVNFPGGFYKHETDCGKYYLCVFGTQYHFSCPQGLVFDLNSSVCNFPENVIC